jgi:WD40 repeat protein
MSLGKLKVILAYGIVAALGDVGLMAGHFARGAAPTEAAPASENKTERVDLYGDPLPVGAVLRLGTTRFRLSGYGMQRLDFLPDNKTLICSSEENHSVQFWEARTGKLLREIGLDEMYVRGFGLAPNGNYFAVGGFMFNSPVRPWPEEIRIYETDSGKLVRRIERKDSDLDRCVLIFTPDGKLLFSVGRKGLLRIEEVSTGVELLNHQFPGDVVSGMTLTTDGSTLAFASGPNSRKLYVWKWKDGEEPGEIKVRDRVGRSLAFSRDGSNLAEVEDIGQGLRIWDVATGRLLHQLEPPHEGNYYSSSAAYSPDGKYLAISFSNRNAGGIDLWDATTGRFRRILESKIGAIGMIAFSPDSQLLMSTSGAVVSIWDLVTNKELRTYPEAHTQSISTIVASTNGFIATSGDDGTIRIWDEKTGKQRQQFSHDYWVRAIALSPDSKKLASSSLDDTVCLWDLATGRRIYKLAGHGRSGGFRALGFTPDGKYFLAWGDDMYLRKWDVANGKAVFEHKLHPKGVDQPEDEDDFRRELLFHRGQAAFTPDSKQFVLEAGGEYHVFETSTGNELLSIPKEGTLIVGLAISPDSKLLLAAEYAKQIQVKQPDGTVQNIKPTTHPVTLWELASGKVIERFQLPGDYPGPVAFSPDGKLIAAAEIQSGQPILILDVAKGDKVGATKGFRGNVRRLAFTADGKRLVSGMNDTSALVWDLAELLPKER